MASFKLPMSRKTLVTALVAALALAAVAVPVFVAIRIAQGQGLESEKSRVLGYAHDVLRRSDDTTRQVEVGVTKLRDAGAQTGPCSPKNVALMREIDLASSYVQAIGHVQGDRLDCSSINEGGALELGSVDYTSKRGVRVRDDVQFPFAKGVTFIVVEEFGYAAIVHKNLPIDAATQATDVGLVTFSTSNNQVLTSRGRIAASWIATLGDRRSRAFVSGDTIVGVVRSSSYEIGAIASIPTTNIDDRARDAAALLVPLGAVAGLTLAGAVVFLAHLQLALPAVLRAAFRRREFFLAYQPVVELATGRWIGAEVLIRWRRPSGELVRPDLFVPLVEDAGLGRRLTEHVIDLVRADCPRLFAEHPDFHLAINLTAADLQTRETVSSLERLCIDLGAGPRNIIAEATERGFLERESVLGVLQEFRHAGIRVAIDDFGTGYSSLSYLEAFEVDALKIDKSFVDPLGVEAATSNVVFHIIDMAKELHLELVAEGVETEAQAEILRSAGVTYVQGWLYARPMGVDELLDALPAHTRQAPEVGVPT